MQGFSDEERKKLAKVFKKEVVKNRATKLGTSVNDLTQRVVSGKYQWVKKTEIYQEEEVRRKISAASQPTRALRDGKESITSKLIRRVRECRTLTSSLCGRQVISNHEQVDVERTISSIESRAKERARALHKIEEEIEAKKASDPVMSQGEAVLIAMSRYKQLGDIEKVKELSHRHGSLLADYQERRKSLTYLISSARFERTSLQHEYWKIMQSCWLLQIQIINQGLNQLQNIRDQLHAVRASDLDEEVDIFQKKYDVLVERQDQLSKGTPGLQTETDKAMQQWDAVNPVMESMGEQLDYLSEVIDKLIIKYTPRALDPVENLNRMAFQDKRK